MKRIIIITATALIIFLPAVSSGQGGDGEGKKRMGPPEGKGGKQQELIKTFDKDGDGKLSEEELVAVRTAREEKMRTQWTEQFKGMDKDGNESISIEEWISFHETRIAAAREKMQAGEKGKRGRKGMNRGDNGAGKGEDPAADGTHPENDAVETGPVDPGNKDGI